MVADAPFSTDTAETFNVRIADRRKRRRLAVQWPVRMWRMHKQVLDTYTVNVSSSGFYCVCSQPLSPGETLIAVLEIPGPGGDREFQKVVLRCGVLVLRIETLTHSCNCGIAFRILNYSVLREASIASSSEESQERSPAAIAEKAWKGSHQNAAIDAALSETS